MRRNKASTVVIEGYAIGALIAIAFLAGLIMS